MTGDTTRPRPPFERQDAPPRGVTYAILALFAGIAVSGVFVAVLLHSFEPERHGSRPTALELAQPPAAGPRLETAPEADGARVEAQARRMLEGYAWVDRSAGVARIPIERAMELTAKQGWPDDQRKTAP